MYFNSIRIVNNKNFLPDEIKIIYIQNDSFSESILKNIEETP